MFMSCVCLCYTSWNARRWEKNPYFERKNFDLWEKKFRFFCLCHPPGYPWQFSQPEHIDECLVLLYIEWTCNGIYPEIDCVL